MKKLNKASILCIMCIGLSVTGFAQKKEKIDLSAALSAQMKESDLHKRNYQYAVEVEKNLYSGYTVLGIDPKIINNVKIGKGSFKIKSNLYDEKVKLTLKEKNGANLAVLSQWAEQNVSFEGDMIFIINDVVLNVKPNQVLLDQNYILDYEVVFVDQLEFDKPISIVKLRTKTKENLKKSAKVK